MRVPVDIIAEAINPVMVNPRRAKEAAHAAIGQLIASGYEIVRRRPADRVFVDGGPPRRPLLTNAVAGEVRRRGVFADDGSNGDR